MDQRDKEIERNRMKMQNLLTQDDTGVCTLGLMGKIFADLGVDVLGPGWGETKFKLSKLLSVDFEELEKVEAIHDDRYQCNGGAREKFHRKAYQYLIDEHGFPPLNPKKDAKP